MGAWGIGTFENDDAADWLYELEDSSDLTTIDATLSVVASADEEYLEAPDCSAALAAAEIVAALRGHPIADLPDNARAWLEAHRALEASPLVADAQSAIQRIRTNSELKELWEESDDFQAWLTTLDDLAARLQAPTSSSKPSPP